MFFYPLIFAMKNLSYSNLIYACLGFIGLMLSVGIAQAFRPRRRVGPGEASASDQAVRQEIEVMRSVVAEVKQRAEDQERRLKWLERQLRTATAKTQALDDDLLVTDAPPQPRGMIERRYQVLKLARQGLGIEEIAARLSLPHGEVSLILGLCSLQAGKMNFNLQVR